ncbi:MAG: hypothetical protein K9N34_09650, partial [Candidatus Marinimicrobia bacterium]|nr:hypothetical protein [Candidatus Neomarinimicrobiota bacterium]MCF7902659.1 hypothetical protein [Candidatus Neomarinimicrobiota bacterium]
RMPDNNYDPEFYISSVGGLIESIPGYWEAGELGSWIGIRDFNHNLVWQLHAKDFLGADAEPGLGGFEWKIIELPARDQFILFCKNRGIYGIDLLAGSIKWQVPGTFSRVLVEKNGDYFYCGNKKDRTRYLYRSNGELVTQITIHFVEGEFQIWGDSLLLDATRLFKLPQFEIIPFIVPDIYRGGGHKSLSSNIQYLGSVVAGNEYTIAVTAKSGQELPYIPVNFLDSAIPQKLQISNDGNHIYFMVPSGDVTPKYDRFVHINLEGVPGWNVY